jgi:peptidoglycan/xylan/chitin deacetylase (PgdA/CDA1 family)
VTAARLDEHFRTLRALGCAMLSLADWTEITARRMPAPPRAVMVTFDDGYRSVLTRALPVLEAHGIPAAVFVTTSAVERQSLFWFDAVAGAAGETAVERAKSLGWQEWRDVAARAERRAVAGDPHAPLTVDDVRRLAAHPLVTIAAHSVSHPILANAPAAVQREEIDGSCAALKSWIGRRPDAFAYPNGRPGVDYTAETVRLAAESGIVHAFTVGERFADPCGPQLEAPRFLAHEALTGVELAHRLAVAWPRASAEAMA